MALPLGKLTILIGAGLVGSVVAKEGRLPDVSGLVSGAFKVVLRQLQSSDSSPTVKTPHNDALSAQVDFLRQELQLLNRGGPITIVNASGAGGKTYVTVVIVGVGFGVIWWKGWFRNMMFATRRSLNEATSSIGVQLGGVYKSIEDAKRKTGAKIDSVDKKMDEVEAIVVDTKEDIQEVQSKAEQIGGNVNGIQVLIVHLESKIRAMEENQMGTTEKVAQICNFTESLQNGTTPAYIQGPSSMPALELPPVSPSPRAAQVGLSQLYLEQPSITPPIPRSESLPPTRSADPPSPLNTVGTDQESTTTTPISEKNFSSNHVDSKKSTPTGPKINGSSSGGFFGMNLPSLLRTRSTADTLVQQTRQSS